MLLRMPRVVPESGLPLFGLLVPLSVMSSLFFQGAAWVFLTLHFPDGAPPGSGYVPNRASLALLLALFVVFAVSGTAWSFLVARGRVPLASGAGFVLGGTGMSLRVAAEVGLNLDLLWADDTTVALLLLGRGVGLVVYVFGLALVVAACASHLRLARRVPPGTRFAA